MAGSPARRLASPQPLFQRGERSVTHSPAGLPAAARAFRSRCRQASATGGRKTASRLRLAGHGVGCLASGDRVSWRGSPFEIRRGLRSAEGHGEAALHPRAGHHRLVPALYVREIRQIDLVAFMPPGPAEDREISDGNVAGDELDFAEPAIEHAVEAARLL